MTNTEHHLRNRMSAVPKSALADVVLAAMARVGGLSALAAALSEAENERARRLSRRRRPVLRRSAAG